jgi:hypothetical protein
LARLRMPGAAPYSAGVRDDKDGRRDGAWFS